MNRRLRARQRAEFHNAESRCRVAETPLAGMMMSSGDTKLPFVYRNYLICIYVHIYVYCIYICTYMHRIYIAKRINSAIPILKHKTRH
jgi:hypothetical protein